MFFSGQNDWQQEVQIVLMSMRVGELVTNSHPYAVAFLAQAVAQLLLEGR